MILTNTSAPTPFWGYISRSLTKNAVKGIEVAVQRTLETNNMEQVIADIWEESVKEIEAPLASVTKKLPTLKEYTDLLDDLRKKGYTITVINNSGGNVEAKISRGMTLVCRFRAQIATFPWCCGLKEIGGFEYQKNEDYPDVTDYLAALIAYNWHTNHEEWGDGAVGRKVVTYNLNGTPRTTFWQQRIVDIYFPDTYNLVATFMNTTGRKINTYIEKT